MDSRIEFPDPKVVVLEQNLSNLLALFASKYNLMIDLKGNFDKIVRNEVIPVSQDEFLEQLSKKYNFQWYILNNTLYVSDNRYTKTINVKAKGSNINNLIAYLTEASAYTERFPIKLTSSKNFYIFSGPDHYVDRQIQFYNSYEENHNLSRIKIISGFQTQFINVTH